MCDELLLGGEIQETSKKNVLKAIAAQDLLQEVSNGENAIELWLALVPNSHNPKFWIV